MSQDEPELAAALPSAASGKQTLAIFLLGAVGLAAGYFGLPWLVRGGALAMDGTVLRLIADGLAYGGFAAAAWFFVARNDGQGWRALGFGRCPASFLGIGVFLAVAWMIASSLIYSLAGVWHTAIAYGAQETAPYRGNLLLLAGLFLLAGPVAACVEEILFRGVLYGWLRQRLNVAVSAVISAVLFAAAHPSVFIAGAAALIDTVLFAVLLALLYEASRSLWAGILSHALYNMGLLDLYLYQG